MGLLFYFFQKYWGNIGQYVSNAIINFFEGGRMLKNVNHTIITLIPKVKQVESIKDLRPIRLCNVFYKIITKILTNRLQAFIDSIIDEEQNAFVKGRLIFDNILHGHEFIHSLNQRKNGKNYGMALKLDVSKAYEYVEWSFLQHML